MPPLPLRDDPLVARLPDIPKSVYIECILPAEEDAATTAGEGSLKLICIRILGALLVHIPTTQGCLYVASEIAAAMEDPANRFDELEELGRLYYDHFICLFRMNKVRTPIPSSHPSRPSFGRRPGWLEKELVETPKDHCTAKKTALIRDGFQCVLTKAPDFNIWASNEDAFPPNAGGLVVYTQCAHIMPESTNDFSSVKDRNGKEIWAAGVWTMLNRIGYGNIHEELKGSAIHGLGNILTLQSDVHAMFDNLNLWFEAIPGKEHTYNVRTFPPNVLARWKIENPIQFTVHNIDIPGIQRPVPAYLPLPNPRYLEIHAVCCRVAHMSGAAKYLDTMIRNVEEIRVLAEDGGSADVLVHALSRLPLVEPV